jgi:hypothetical protein
MAPERFLINIDMNAPIFRRWLQFRLRTLLIAVAFFAAACCYVKQQARIVAARQAILNQIAARQGGYLVGEPEAEATAGPNWVRRLLGDEPVKKVWYCDSNPGFTRGEVASLLPETQIRVGSIFEVTNPCGMVWPTGRVEGTVVLKTHFQQMMEYQAMRIASSKNAPAGSAQEFPVPPAPALKAIPRDESH